MKKFLLAAASRAEYNLFSMENMNHPAYLAALTYIYRFVENSRTHQLGINSSPEASLDRMDRLLDAIGNPQQQFKAIHITGTKGKGSTAAFCAAGLHAAGYRIGLNTSPHLQTFRERIQINRELITEDEVVALVEAIQPTADTIEGLTSFELITALAFQYFAKKQVEIAVIEVGMGGRTDATNILTPLVSVITTISFDHTEYLGDTLTAIASEKAGIIKPGVPVVIGPGIPTEPRQVISQAAYLQNSPLFEVGEAFKFTPITQSLETHSQSFWAWTAGEQAGMDDFLENHTSAWRPIQFSIPLLGRHQVENSMVAFAVLRLLKEQGFSISDAAIQEGFADVHWEGRFEILQSSPMLVIDAAHNQDSARRLAQALDDLFPGLPVWMIFGASRGKNVLQIIKELKSRITKLLITRSIHPRAAAPETLADQLKDTGIDCLVLDSVEEALSFALANIPSEGVILVSGSTFVAGAARDIWMQHTPQGKGI